MGLFKKGRDARKNYCMTFLYLSKTAITTAIKITIATSTAGTTVAFIAHFIAILVPVAPVGITTSTALCSLGVVEG
jgi:hypothetical protein